LTYKPKQVERCLNVLRRPSLSPPPRADERSSQMNRPTTMAREVGSRSCNNPSSRTRSPN
jgi:hypothetical protein